MEICITHAQEKVCKKECDCDTNNKPIVSPKLKKYWRTMDRYRRPKVWWNIPRKF